MPAFPHRFLRAEAAAARWVIAGQLTLNVVLLLGGAWLASLGNRLAVFLMVLIPLAFLPFSYARVRLHRLLEAHVTRSIVWPATATGLIFDAIMVAQVLTGRQPEPPSILYRSGITWIGAVWFSGHALLLLGYAGVGFVRLARRCIRHVWSHFPAAALPAAEVEIGRRALLQKAGLFGAALPFGVSLSGVSLSYDFRVEEREIMLPAWPAALDGLRVVHLSDIHVGGAMNRRRLLRVASLTNACRPDLVLHSGDFLTHRAGDFDAPLYDALARIRAPHGQWACFGNHDFDDPQRLERRLRDCGVTVLRNRVADLSVKGERIELAGIDYQFDRSQRALAYARIVAAWGPRRSVPRILLNHDPSVFKTLPAGCADLVLSGHTHGGQIGWQVDASHAITVIGLAGLPDQGLFSRDDMCLYVTRCVGFYGYPMRIGIPPEIALLVLRSLPTQRQA
ncbi:MAG: putative phosphoesterase [Deltaproteobacteria bacterium]|nr:putative phosphoesterase [Deltaproteobacteria bacterium]